MQINQDLPENLQIVRVSKKINFVWHLFLMCLLLEVFKSFIKEILFFFKFAETRMSVKGNNLKQIVQTLSTVRSTTGNAFSVIIVHCTPLPISK